MGFGGFIDPKERAAAQQAAEAMEAARAAADAQTEALATAIVEGFALVANAILAASGQPPAVSGIPGPVVDLSRMPFEEDVDDMLSPDDGTTITITPQLGNDEGLDKG